ncbi:glycosyltransferase family 2 protein [Anaerolineales bacterium HSG24]|nr:glycosyltransferase family 2 protein [Anaerolineales bacterium HSG24]
MTEITPFSIIVPVYNGAETLEALLTILTAQDYPPEKYEIIVVNDGSTDNSAEIAQNYPVNLIDLKPNQGRVVARNTGAKAAQYERLVFNDVRVTPNKNLLRTLNERNYQPLIPNIEDYDGSRWGFARFFYLLLCKLYYPYYPLSQAEPEFFITPDNFDEMPKGTGLFCCDKQLWLACQPSATNKMVSDDTKILRQIVEHAHILRTLSVAATYKQRTEFGPVMAHTLQRGPLFGDYYLRPGGYHFKLYLIIWLGIVLFMIGLFIWPIIVLLFMITIGVTGLFVIALYLSQSWLDIVVVFLYFPFIIVAFGFGILKWQIAELTKGKV